MDISLGCRSVRDVLATREFDPGVQFPFIVALVSGTSSWVNAMAFCKAQVRHNVQNRIWQSFVIYLPNLWSNHSFESSRRDDSNEWLHHRILSRIRQIVFCTRTSFCSVPSLVYIEALCWGLKYCAGCVTYTQPHKCVSAVAIKKECRVPCVH